MSKFDSRVMNLVTMGFRLDILPPNEEHPTFAVKIRLKEDKFIGIAPTLEQALTQAERGILQNQKSPPPSD